MLRGPNQTLISHRCFPFHSPFPFGCILPEVADYSQTPKGFYYSQRARHRVWAPGSLIFS